MNAGSCSGVAFSVAVRLAGGGNFKFATAGKPDCYRNISVAQ